MKARLLETLLSVERLANASRVKRFCHNPFKYVYAIAFRQFIYPGSRHEKILKAKLFFGKEVTIALPASTDIYLTGGKSHISEITLARFLIKNLKAETCFLDIGAHYGYFTLIAAEIIKSGKIMSFEAAEKTFSVLQTNTRNINNVQVFHQAVSNTSENVKFYEFDNLHSEYNSTDASQFKDEIWYKSDIAKVTEVRATTIDQLKSDFQFVPDIIKIDVEGAEFNVIAGGAETLAANSPIVIMEYLEPKRKNTEHKKALNFLIALHYVPHIITHDGELQSVSDIDLYLEQQQLESDNIVFLKTVVRS